MDDNIKNKIKEENPELYDVAFEKGTERPFTGKYYESKEDGTYNCAVCGNALFSSDAKFDSGTGWPSFYKPISENSVIENVDNDHGMTRTEITCGKCGAHLGHVFPDGPKDKGGNRYCINSVCLGLEEK